MDLKGKKVLVLGLARTGVATVRFLVERGARVKVSEMKPPGELEGALQELKGLPLDWEMGGHTLPFFLDAELIVVSPGVPMDLQPLRQAREKGLPAVSEIELASRFLRRPMIAITGTNGKTTTTTLMGEMFRAGGKAAFVGGNIGNPLMNFVAGSQREEWAVVEVSSFQLEGIDRFRPRVALLLNITEDHLDRHPSFQEYGEIKGRSPDLSVCPPGAVAGSPLQPGEVGSMGMFPGPRVDYLPGGRRRERGLWTGPDENQGNP
jgi:UDP-N-acetylmuramoylalanine--D-glutamate ligase